MNCKNLLKFSKKLAEGIYFTNLVIPKNIRFKILENLKICDLSQGGYFEWKYYTRLHG